MDDKNNITSPILGAQDRFIVCNLCGGDVFIEVNEDFQYCTKCVECRFGLGIDMTPIEGQGIVDSTRRMYNETIIKEHFEARALCKMGVKEGDYALVAVSDGFIVVLGDANVILAYLSTTKRRDERNYRIYQLENEWFEPKGNFFRFFDADQD